jgi:hypothetical protein
MFTWICPKCGREVPPSYNACPDCEAREKLGETPAQVATQPPPVSAPPPQYAAAPPAPRAAVPTWLLAILFAFAFLGLGAGVYWTIHYFRNGPQAAAAPADTVPVKGPAKANALQKYVEVSGIRFVENPKHETEARFVVTNHSDADISGLAGTVNIWGRTVKSEEEAAGHFSFKIDSLRPNESKEAEAPFTTKLKVYELPDWQNVSSDVQITSP